MRPAETTLTLLLDMVPDPITPRAAAVESAQRIVSPHGGDARVREHGRAASFLTDLPQERLLAGLATQLDLTLDCLQPADLPLTDLYAYEVVLAAPAEADRVHGKLHARPVHPDTLEPAVVRIVAGEVAATAQREGLTTIDLSQDAAAVLAQLSVVVYAHRAVSRRFQSAMEELHLNRRIFSSVTSGITIADANAPDMPLTYVNPAFEVMTGYCMEDVLGKNCRFLQRDERDQPGVAEMREAIAQRRQITVVLRNYRKDGSSFWNELFISPIRNREGVLTHFVGIQNDVSARVEFEAALRQSEKLAAVGRLAASIAHEINNPLESVMNLLYLAQHEADPNMVKHYVQEADNEVKRVAIITTQSLRFYKQNTRPTSVDCDDLMTSVLDLYLPKLSRFNITTERRRRTHVRVVCMESEIRQVMSNLVRNAIDAMRVHGGRLTVRTRMMTEWRSGRRGVAMTLADNGAGIAPHVLEKLYTAFFTTKGDAGTGLGLWVSASIVQRHGGRMLVRSTVHPQRHGTVFTVFLPFDGVIEPEPQVAPVHESAAN